MLTNQLYSQSTEGQSPVFISGRSTQEWCRNQFVWLRASPPACKTTAERVTHPWQPCDSLPVKLAHRDASSCLVNSLVCSFPPQEKPQLHHRPRIKFLLSKKTSVSSPEALCEHFQQHSQCNPSLWPTATQPNKALSDINVVWSLYQVNQEKAMLWGKICSSCTTEVTQRWREKGEL